MLRIRRLGYQKFGGVRFDKITNFWTVIDYSHHPVLWQSMDTTGTTKVNRALLMLIGYRDGGVAANMPARASQKRATVGRRFLLAAMKAKLPA